MSANEVNEHAIALYSAVLKDENGTGIASANINSLTLTLYDVKTGTVINSQEDTNIKNTNNGTIDGSGNFTLLLMPADNQMIGTDDFETHIALIQVIWDTTKKGSRAFPFTVKKVVKVDAA